MDACRDIFYGNEELLFRRALSVSKNVYNSYFFCYEKPDGDESEKRIKLSIAYCWLWLKNKGLISEITPIHTFCHMIIRHAPSEYLKVKHGDKYIDGLWSNFKDLYKHDSRELSDMFRILKTKAMQNLLAV